MRPSKRFLQFAIAWNALACVFLLLPHFRVFAASEIFQLNLIWLTSGILLIVAAIYDARRNQNLSAVNVTRRLANNLALGVKTEIHLDISNPYPFDLHLKLTELSPDMIQITGLPQEIVIAANTSGVIQYFIVPVVRGNAEFGQTELLINSRWGLWQRMTRCGEASKLKIYPNFSPLAHYATMNMEQNIQQMGIHLAKRRGEGLEFHQLREFREGDALRQIDWKATARQRKPISREYQDERDQDIIFLLDCGRRLRTKDEGGYHQKSYSHFDHALNALLMTAYVALRQGDSTGLLSFAGEQRWLSPLKGKTAINTLLNQLYDLHSSTQSSDFLQAAQQLMKRHRKRSLIVVISNIRDEDSEDLIAMYRLLSKQHIVMVASLREDFLLDNIKRDVENFNDALIYCGTQQFLQNRRLLLQKLKMAGVMIVDSAPQQLHIELVNEYLKMKRSGRL